MTTRTGIALLAFAVVTIAAVWFGTSGTRDTEEAIFSSPGQRTAFRLRQLQTRLLAYQKDNGALPKDLAIIGGRGSERLRVDEWNRSVIYRVTGSDFEVRSAGPDGMPNTSDDIVVPSSARDTHETDSIRS